jgi:hypothetical protein
MRLTSDFFVSALVRRVFGCGGFAAIERKGSPEAGAIFIRLRRRNGQETLYGPAPQTAFAEGEGDDRRFEVRLAGATPEAIEDLLLREVRFDPDLWLVELETDDVAGLLDLAV